MNEGMRVLVAAVAGVVGAGAGATPAAADDYSLHVTGHLRSGWTDNLLNGTSAETMPPKQADFYTQLMPGILGTWSRPRLVQELYYELEANLYLEASEGTSTSHRAGWRAFWMVSPLTEVTTNVQASGGVLNTFNTWGQTQAGELVYLPSTSSRFAMVEAQELLTRQLTRSVRINQSAVARTFRTFAEGAVEASTGYELGLGGGVDKSWEWNALGLNATATYVTLGVGSGDGSRSMHGGITGSWRRDLSQHWTTLVDLGVTGIIPIEEGDQLSWGPTAGVAINYFQDWGSAGMSARRTIAPNLFLQANTVSDMALAHAYLPLPWLRDRLRQPRLTFGASAGLGRTSVIDASTGDRFADLGIQLVDVGVGYQIREQVTAGLRYQYVAQQVPDDPAIMLPNFNTYSRNSVILSFYGRWPSRVAAEVPTRAALRVDRSGASPTGEGGDGAGAGGAEPGADRR